MVSKVNICNAALMKIGGSLISSIDEDNTEARLCKQRFDKVLDLLLEEHPWNFAIHRATLTRLSTTPEFEYSYEYQLPTNPYCLRVLEMYGNYDHKIEGRKLLTDEGTCQIKYIKRTENFNEMSLEFIECVAYALAIELLYSITGSISLKGLLEQEFSIILRKAKTRDANQGSPKTQTNGMWISGRS